MHIVDTTSGFCRDSWAIASVGCKVTALERCIWLHWMQQEALERVLNSTTPDDTLSIGQSESEKLVEETCRRITPVSTDACQWLQQQSENLSGVDEDIVVDVIYIDPMYPERKKSAAVKKEMQALHRLLGPDLDSNKLIECACKAATQLATKRIVVKRPAWAEPIAGFADWQAATSHESENTRYDIYLHNRH